VVAVNQPRHVFVVGESYTRNDIYDIVGVPGNLRGGDWETGYHRHGDAFFIFANVGVAGQTGHDYANSLEGDRLAWCGKTGAKLGHSSIQTLLELGRRGQVYVFYRIQRRGPFIYQGLGRPVDIKDEVPVRIVWAFDTPGELHPERPPEEVGPAEAYVEGAVTKVLVNSYERNLAARRACIDHWGTKCQVCGFDFEEVYGEIGRGFIHVHHIRSLAEIGASYVVDPVLDLRPVCPNCHAMLHREKPPLEIDLLRLRLLRASSCQ
jgi:5-methylcytosine-specific restriction protein A